MGWNDGFSYPPLKTDTQTRVIVLAPGQGDDPIRCFLLVIDLDEDWDPQKTMSESRPSLTPRRMCFMEARGPDGEVLQQAFTVPALRFNPEKNSGLYPFQRYMALSYVWGDQSRRYEIFLDGKPFYVGYNLYMALKHLRRQVAIVALGVPQLASSLEARADDVEALGHHLQSEGHILWIDTICINQADIVEREAQIKLMSRIYQQADHVHAELGDSEGEAGRELLQLLHTIIKAGGACDSAQQAFSESHPEGPSVISLSDDSIMSAIASQYNNFQSRSTMNAQVNIPNAGKPKLEDHGIPPEDHPFWARWRLFLSSTYFRRLWVVQEFSLAKRVTLRFGNVAVEPGLVSDCIGYLVRYSTNRSFYLFSKDDSENKTQFSGFLDLVKQRRLVSDLTDRDMEQSSLLSKLDFARDTAATDLRDKIYGMLGLASDGPNFHDLVSYLNCVEDVYIGFALRFIGKGQGLEMLYQVHSRVSETLCIPTWVPVSEEEMVMQTVPR